MTQEQDYCGSQIIVCLAVKLLSQFIEEKRRRRKKKKRKMNTRVKRSGGTLPHPGAAARRRCHGPRRPQRVNRRVWGVRALFWGQLSAGARKCLVRPAGQTPRPANNHRLTAAVASTTCAHGGEKVHRTGCWRDGTPPSSLTGGVSSTASSDERCNCNKTKKLAVVWKWIWLLPRDRPNNNSQMRSNAFMYLWITFYCNSAQ